MACSAAVERLTAVLPRGYLPAARRPAVPQRHVRQRINSRQELNDEFAIIMDGAVEADFIKLSDPDSVVAPDKQGSVLVKGEPVGKKMGWVKAGKGHQILLPKGSAYRFRAAKPGVVLMQTILGDLSVQKWAEICYK